MRINYLAAIDYSNSWDTDTITRNQFVPGINELVQQEGLTFVGTEHSIDVSGIVTAGLDFNQNHNIRATSITLRKTDDRVSNTTGFTSDVPESDITEIEWIERELFTNQLQGDHFFPSFNEFAVNWRVSRMKAERDSPDNREFRYDGGDFTSRADSNLRRFSVLDDTVDDFGVDMSAVFYGPLSAMITPRAGYVHSEKTRDSEIRRFGFGPAGPIAQGNELLRMPIEQILAIENISPEGFELLEITRPTDSYTADNELNAFYGELEFNFDDRFRFTLGGRQEDFEQTTSTFDLFRPEVEVRADLDQSKFLPAASATFIHYDHQFRLAYSETVSRPDFRELSTSAFTDPVTGKSIIGNPDLQITEIKNYDFRWEWYFAFSDYMSLGLFYKEFTLPIEASIFSATTRATTYINALGAENQGIEYEIYKRLDFLPNDFLGGIGEDFYVQANVAYIDSSIDLAPEDRGVLTSTNRPLQGQSDWLLNAQVGYEPLSGITATLLYHYFGERIAEVGILGAPDLIEQPFGELNFIYIQELNDNWKITAKAKNIMDEDSEILQGGFLTTGYNRGREFSVQFDYTF